MPVLQPTAPITAIVYGDGARVAPIVDSIIDHLASEGCRLAGLIQRDRIRAGRSRCDMLMEDLTTGEKMAVSQDRGEEARGCRLDVEALINAAARVRSALATQPDLLIVNKFGKTECEGGGCRGLIAEAVECGVPVVIAIPRANLESWRHFAGDLAIEHDLNDLPADGAQLCRRLGLARPATAERVRAPSCASAHV